MRHRRGQAALEFLTTYGWAFLVILVMIGALAYFGVINPTKFLPERCQFGTEMTCSDYLFDSQGLHFYIQNNLGQSLTVSSISVTDPNENLVVVCTYSTTMGGSQKVLFDATSGATCTTDFASATYVEGERYKFDVTLMYKLQTGQFDRPLRGDLFLTYQG